MQEEEKDVVVETAALKLGKGVASKEATVEGKN